MKYIFFKKAIKVMKNRKVTKRNKRFITNYAENWRAKKYIKSSKFNVKILKAQKWLRLN